MEHASLHAFTVFMGFFAIMNPIANVPLFLSLTGEDDRQITRAVAWRTLLYAFLIVAVFSIAGKIIFDVFGITLPAFRITGGVLVALIGFHMLHGGPSKVQHPGDDANKKSRQAALDVALTPLAMPMLAGPGTIATAMSFSAGGGLLQVGVTITMFALLCAITYVCFVFGKRFVNYLGANALGAITRMMGLILAVIGVQMLITGIHGAFHFLG